MKNKVDEAIDEALGIAEELQKSENENQPDDFIPPSEVEIEFVEPDYDDTDLDSEDDMKMAAAYLKNMMKRGYTTIDQLQKLAISTQHPRVYESIAKILKETTTATKELIDLHKKGTGKEIAPSGSQREDQGNTGQGGVNINKAIVFSGTPEEFQEMIKTSMETREKEVQAIREDDK